MFFYFKLKKDINQNLIWGFNNFLDLRIEL